MNILGLIIEGVTIFVCAMAATGCGKASEVNLPFTPTEITTEAPEKTTEAEPNVVSVTNDPTPTATATATPTPTVSVTYYSLTHTVSPNGGQAFKTYTATGYCLIYNSETYCWDDGIHVINFIGGAVGNYTYFGLSCNGTCATDVATSPVQVDQSFTGQIITGVTVSGVLSGGTATTVTCNDDGSGSIVCPSFTINTNQGPF